MSLPWDKRAVEEANLFNPAFSALLLGTAAKEYAKKANKPLPFALAFLVPPIALHGPTRGDLPKSTLTGLLPWLQGNRTSLVGFAGRVAGLGDVTREALLFGLGHGALAITDGCLAVTKSFKGIKTSDQRDFTNEATACVEASAFLGRWFAAAGTTATIYAAWGVAP